MANRTEQEQHAYQLGRDAAVHDAERTDGRQTQCQYKGSRHPLRRHWIRGYLDVQNATPDADPGL